MKYLILSLLLMANASYAATASWYGIPFHGRLTASGERFNMNDLTCASNTHKMGTKLEVTNITNGKKVIVKVNDTGGFKKYGRTLDLSRGAFAKIANIDKGLIEVTIRKIN